MERLHLGSGTVYLRGWVNIDVASPSTYLAVERPNLVAAYETDEAHYYAKHLWKAVAAAIAAGERASREYLCDRFGSWASIPCRTGNAIELLSRQTLEHLSVAEARAGLREAKRVLARGGILRLSVPDHDATLTAWRETGDNLYLRHLFGPRTLRMGYDAGYHVTSYTRADLCALVASREFVSPQDDDNPHAYPAICLRWTRP